MAKETNGGVGGAIREDFRDWGKWPELVTGAVVQYEGKPWYVGLVNGSRARLDPLGGQAVTIDPASGRSFNSFGQSINISPASRLPVIEDIETLDEGALRRLVTLTERAETAANKPVRQFSLPDDDGEEDDMAVAGAPVAAKKTVDKAAVKKAADAKAKTAKVKKAKATGPAENPCKCGCTEKTRGHFFPGHDARFKGWMLKIERGEATKESLLKKAVIAQYKWVKNGKGERATTNYKGEPHSGYSKS